MEQVSRWNIYKCVELYDQICLDLFAYDSSYILLTSILNSKIKYLTWWK